MGGGLHGRQLQSRGRADTGLAAAGLQVLDCELLTFLSVDTDHRLIVVLMAADLLIDVTEWASKPHATVAEQTPPCRAEACADARSDEAVITPSRKLSW